MIIISKYVNFTVEDVAEVIKSSLFKFRANSPDITMTDDELLRFLLTRSESIHNSLNSLSVVYVIDDEPKVFLFGTVEDDVYHCEYAFIAPDSNQSRAYTHGEEALSKQRDFLYQQGIKKIEGKIYKRFETRVNNLHESRKSACVTSGDISFTKPNGLYKTMVREVL